MISIDIFNDLQLVAEKFIKSEDANISTGSSSGTAKKFNFQELTKWLSSMECLKKFKKLLEAFNPRDDELGFESFAKFPLFFFRLVLFDLKHFEENASLRTKVKFYARGFLFRIGVILCIIGTIQI